MLFLLYWNSFIMPQVSIWPAWHACEHPPTFAGQIQCFAYSSWLGNRCLCVWEQWGHMKIQLIVHWLFMQAGGKVHVWVHMKHQCLACFLSLYFPNHMHWTFFLPKGSNMKRPSMNQLDLTDFHPLWMQWTPHLPCDPKDLIWGRPWNHSKPFWCPYPFLLIYPSL